MFVPRLGQRLVLAIVLGVIVICASPAVSHAGTLSMTTATTTGPTQNGIFAPAPNDYGTLNMTNNAWIVNTGDDYINNYELPGTPTFYGVTVTSNMVLMKYTFYGDTGLKGSVDAADIANGLFGISAHLTGWANDKTDYGTQQATIAAYDI